MTLSAPILKTVKEMPSTFRRVRMSHKFGIVAVNDAGKVYLTRDMNDPNCTYSI